MLRLENILAETATAGGNSIRMLLLSTRNTLKEDTKRCVNGRVDVVIADNEVDLYTNYLVTENVEMITIDEDGMAMGSVVEIISQLRKLRSLHGVNYGFPFICIYGEEFARNPRTRAKLTSEGVQMLTHSLDDVVKASNEITKTLTLPESNPSTLRFQCPYCARTDLCEEGLWLHCPLYHTSSDKLFGKCPICDKEAEPHMQDHIRNNHGPVRRGEVAPEIDAFHSVYGSGVVVVVSPEKKILLVQEKRGRGYYLPGGRLNPGEGVCEGAKRETLEEAGMKVDLEGVIKLDYVPTVNKAGESFHRMRVYFLAQPSDPNSYDAIKMVPDYESLSAAWVSEEDLESGALAVKNNEPLNMLRYVLEGNPVLPMTMINST